MQRDGREVGAEIGPGRGADGPSGQSGGNEKRPPARRWRRASIALALLALLVAVAWFPVRRHLEAAALLLRFEAQGGEVDGLGELYRHEVDEAPLVLGTTEGTVDARRYVPSGVGNPPPVLLVHGVHPAGIEESRLRDFARVLASTGVEVVTPRIEPLTRYRIEPEAIRLIGAAAGAHARRAGADAVGIVGISFSGGLALIAAADAAYRRHVAFVLTVGAHHDLARVTRWYAGEPIEGPEGRPPPVEPHPYGAGVLIYDAADVLFPPDDLARAKQALEALLRGRRAAAAAHAPLMSPEGRAQLERILDRSDDAALGAQLLEVIDARRATLAAVSPRGRLQGLEAPVFLLHGAADPVVPSTETRWLAREVPEDALEHVVITPFLRHAEQELPPSLGERWELVHLMADVLEEAREVDR